MWTHAIQSMSSIGQLAVGKEDPEAYRGGGEKKENMPC